MSTRSFITVPASAAVCAVLALLPAFVQVAAFLVFAVVVRFYPDPSLPKGAIVYGVLGGACLFFAIALFMAHRNGELPLAFYGEPPYQWTRIAFRLSFPAGGFLGGVIGYVTAWLVRDAHPRTVFIGAVIGFVIATMVTGAYVAWLLHLLSGHHVKYPSVVGVYCFTVWLLSLLVGGVSGTILGALFSRMRGYKSDSL